MASKQQQSCRTCAYYKTEGTKRILRGDAFPCGAPETPMPNFPASVLGKFGFSWPPHRSYMTPDEGVDCPVYVSKKG